MLSTAEMEPQTSKTVSLLPTKVPASSPKDDTFSLKPAGYCHLLLLREGRGADVIFVVGQAEEKIKAHQLFLVARSPVFSSIFRAASAEKEIRLRDVEPNPVRQFLEFIYADVFDPTVLEALDLLRLAHQYGVRLLIQKCEELLKTNMKPSDAFVVFQAAMKYERVELMRIAGDLLARNMNFASLSKSVAVMEKETLVYLLQRDNLTATAKEIDLFRLALSWGELQVRLKKDRDLRTVLADVIPLIRFPIMSLEEFTSVVVPAKVLSEAAVIQIFRKELAKSLPFRSDPRHAAGVLLDLFRFSWFDLTYDVEFRSCINEYFEFTLEIPEVKSDRRVGICGLVLTYPKRERICPPSLDSRARGEDHLRLCIKRKLHSNAKTDEDFQLLHSVSMIVSEWNREVELVLDPPIPINNAEHYRITLEENGSRSRWKYCFSREALHKRTIWDTVDGVKVRLRDCYSLTSFTSGLFGIQRYPIIQKIRLAKI